MGLRIFMQIPIKSANASYSVSSIPKNGETSVNHFHRRRQKTGANGGVNMYQDGRFGNARILGMVDALKKKQVVTI